VWNHLLKRSNKAVIGSVFVLDKLYLFMLLAQVGFVVVSFTTWLNVLSWHAWVSQAEGWLEV